MTDFHRGDPVTYRGARYLVKAVDEFWQPYPHSGLVLIEDEEGFAFPVLVSELELRPYTAVVEKSDD